jgi:hypothetical protein
MLTDRYLEIESAVRGGSVEREQSFRAALAADILHAGPTDRKTILSVTRQIKQFFDTVRTAVKGPNK